MLLALGHQSFVAPEGTISVTELPGSVVITEEADIPDDYIIEKITRTPDKAALRADLKEGVVIPGACHCRTGSTGMPRSARQAARRPAP